MPADIADAGLAHAASRFPERADAIRRLARANCEFRELCIEYELALEGLARFEALSDAGERPEVDDYRSVIAELEVEIGRFAGDGRPGR